MAVDLLIKLVRIISIAGKVTYKFLIYMYSILGERRLEAKIMETSKVSQGGSGSSKVDGVGRARCAKSGNVNLTLEELSEILRRRGKLGGTQILYVDICKERITELQLSAGKEALIYL